MQKSPMDQRAGNDENQAKELGNSPASRLDGVQVLRGIAAVMVLGFHGALIEDRFEFTRNIGVLNVFLDFGFAGVNLFFVISGFIIAWAVAGIPPERAAFTNFVSNRIVRIFPIFWIVWAASAFMLFAIGEDAINAKGDLYMQSIRALLLVDREAHFIVPQAWTLNFEIMFYLVFAFTMLISSRFKAVFFIAWSCLIFLGWAALIKTGMWNSIICLHFIGGVLIAWLVRSGHVARPLLTAVLGVLGWTVSTVLVARGILDAESVAHRLLGFGIPSFLLVWAAASGDLVRHYSHPRILVRLGDSSYSLYLIHLTLLWVWGRFGPDVTSVARYAVWITLMVLIPVWLSLLAFDHVERPVIRFLKSSKSVVQRMLYVFTLGILCLVIGLASMGALRDLIARPGDYDVEVISSDGPGLAMNINGSKVRLMPERQGWATGKILGDGSLEITGWALDRSNNETVTDILLLVNDTLTMVKAPTEAVPDLLGYETQMGRLAGFAARLPRVKADHCVRVIAVLRDGRAAELYYKRDEADPGKPSRACL